MFSLFLTPGWGISDHPWPRTSKQPLAVRGEHQTVAAVFCWGREEPTMLCSCTQQIQLNPAVKIQPRIKAQQSAHCSPAHDRRSLTMEDHHLSKAPWGLGEPRSLALSSGYRGVSLSVEALSRPDSPSQTQNTQVSTLSALILIFKTSFCNS